MRYIPYGRQSIDSKDINEVINVLKSDWITQGPKINEFEDKLAKYCKVKYAVAVSSGTAALHIACLAAGIEDGDEVITSPITFVASANCVLYCAGKPVFVDINPETGNIDAVKLESFLKKYNRKTNKRLKAIIPVHYAGRSCDMRAIYDLAKENDLIIIEDAAHALGGEYKGFKIGSCKYSDMAILSFHPVKTITMGEGGAVLTNSKSFYKKLLMFRNHGIARDDFINKPDGDWYYEMQFPGYNYRLTDIQAAVGISQIEKIDKFVKRRREIAKIYERAFSRSPYFDIPKGEDYFFGACHLYPIQIKDKYKDKKKQIFLKMRNAGLGVQVHYMPVYLHPYYRNLGFSKGLCPHAENFYQKEISIPIYPSMQDKEVDYVIERMFEIFERF